MVPDIQGRLGYRLPDAYLKVLRVQNGGPLQRPYFRVLTPTAWTAGDVACSVLAGIEGGDLGSRESRLEDSAYLIREWGFPEVGVVFSCEGHTAFMLDYSRCGPQGEPRVIYADSDASPGEVPLVLADSFQAFLDGLHDDADSLLRLN